MKLHLLLGISAALAASFAQAKVGTDKAAELDGPKYSCIGAERAGSASGIPEFSGKYEATWPGVTQKQGYEPGPYASEKPLFSITAKNFSEHAAKLSAGQKALFEKYPDVFRMDVYPSHRDFKDSAGVCERTKKNAVEAVVQEDGRAVNGTTGAIPFPFPENGLEAIWNVANSLRVYTQTAQCDIADVYGNGSTAWGRINFKVMTPANDPDKAGSYRDRVNSYFMQGYLLPERDRGFTAVGYQPNDYSKDATQSWQYLPGVRRVRQAPNVGFDYPVPPAGLRTADDDCAFNGSPERYSWKLVGKKEMLIPYHNFRINDPAVKYKDLLRAGTVNPDYIRYELHRAWVIEGTLKPGLRHIYAKRTVYADEDSWLASLADNYDQGGVLTRTPLITYFRSQESGTWHRGVSIYHDLTSGAYEAGYLVNESKQWWRLNTSMSPAMFSPEAAARAGH